jgi:CBS domain-containing protein
MSAYRTGLLVVLDPLDRARIVGVLSEHDMVTAVAKGENIYSPVANLMTRQ